MIKTLFRKVGIDIRRHRPQNDQTVRLVSYLERHNIDCVLDIGANLGQFTCSLRDMGYRGEVVSFEALPDTHATLSDTARADEAWTVAPRMAVADRNGETVFNVADNAVSSSLHAPDPSLRAEGISFQDEKRITVPMHTLETALADLGIAGKRMFLKMDVQGAEMEVLLGAIPILPQVVGVLSEMSVTPLYEGQHTYLAVDATIREKGFDLWDLETGFRSAETHRLLQFDAIYFR